MHVHLIHCVYDALLSGKRNIELERKIAVLETRLGNRSKQAGAAAAAAAPKKEDKVLFKQTDCQRDSDARFCPLCAAELVGARQD